MNNLPHLLQRIFGAPLAIHPAKFDAVMGAVGSRFGVMATDEQILAASSSGPSNDRKYNIEEGIAIIPVQGSLMKKTYGLLAMSGCSSYQTIGAQVEDAYTNPQVQGILLSIDSPGGETSGLFELCDMLTALKDKPVFAIADDSAYSAAYAIASCADRIYLTVSAGVGSIGVICAHVDQSQADKKDGLKYTFIKAGEKKANGNSHEPLSDTAREDIQAEVDRNDDMFTSLVAKNRNLSLKSVQGMEAGCYFAENAVKIGLADKVGTFETAFTDLQGRIEGRDSNAGGALAATAQVSISAGQIGELLNGDKSGDLNNHSDRQVTTMAKKTDLSIDEVIDLHAGKSKKAEDDEYMDKECKEGDDDKDDDDDEEDGEEKDKDGNAAKKGKGDEAKKAKSSAIQIVNLCTLAGMPTLAAEFLARDMSPEDVSAALMKHRAKKSRSVHIPSGAAPTDDTFSAGLAAIKANAGIAEKATAMKKFIVANSEKYKSFRKAEVKKYAEEML